MPLDEAFDARVLDAMAVVYDLGGDDARALLAGRPRGETVNRLWREDDPYDDRGAVRTPREAWERPPPTA